jgi:iron complex transport system substrate-binding protein
VEKSIVGVSRNEAYPPEAQLKPVFSYHDDPEKFLAAHPDLVLIRPMIDRGYPQLISRLEKSGITVVSLQPTTVEAMFAYWEILGVLTGTQTAAAEMIQTFKAQTAQIKSRTQAVLIRKKVYLEAIHKRMKTFSPGAIAVFVLETAGGINVAHDAQAVRNTNIAFYGKEKILSRGRDIDAYIAQYGSMNQPTIAMIKNEPGFGLIKAVANDQILIVDEMIISRPTMRLILGIERIGRFLYPAEFKGGDN